MKRPGWTAAFGGDRQLQAGLIRVATTSKDRRVYALYQLTDEDVAVIEAAMPAWKRVRPVTR